ncbi:MAG: hypothetical protein ACFBZ8_02010 [Opitutales bacterium]
MPSVPISERARKVYQVPGEIEKAVRGIARGTRSVVVRDSEGNTYRVVPFKPKNGYFSRCR